MTTAPPWRILVRDQDYVHKGQINEFESFEAKLIYNDVCTWALTLAYASPAVPDLIAAGAGIQLLHGTDLVLSGPMLSYERQWGKGSDHVIVGGVSDDVWLTWRLCHPEPDNDTPPYDTHASDDFTGTTEALIRHYVDVNCGPSALARRQVPNLSLWTSEGRGSTDSANGRWQPVLDLIQQPAELAGLAFAIRQTDGGIAMTCDDVRDVSATARFTVAFGSLAEFAYSGDAPLADYLYIGGEGDGTARTVKEMQDTDAQTKWYGSPIERWIDASQAKTDADLTLVGNGQLALDGEGFALTVKPTGYGDPQFPNDWTIGDKVGLEVDGIVVTEQVRTIDLVLDASGVKATPTVGVSRSQREMGSTQIERAVRDLVRRMARREAT